MFVRSLSSKWCEMYLWRTNLLKFLSLIIPVEFQRASCCCLTVINSPCSPGTVPDSFGYSRLAAMFVSFCFPFLYIVHTTNLKWMHSVCGHAWLCSTFGFWPRVYPSVDASFSEKRTVPIFRVKFSPEAGNIPCARTHNIIVTIPTSVGTQNIV